MGGDGRVEWGRVERVDHVCGARAGTSPRSERRTSMKWVTRERAPVDRIACPWLISRFIDRDATFLFVPSDQVTQVAEREGAIAYDIPGVELGHQGERCSFDAFLEKY